MTGSFYLLIKTLRGRMGESACCANMKAQVQIQLAHKEPQVGDGSVVKRTYCSYRGPGLIPNIHMVAHSYL